MTASSPAAGRRTGRSRPEARPELPLPVLTGAANALASALLAGDVKHEQVQLLIAETAAATKLEPSAAASCLYALAMRDNALLEAEPLTALQAQLKGFLLFASAGHASLWLVERGEELCVAKVGRPVAKHRLRAAARAALAGTRRSAGSELRAVPLVRHGVRSAALVTQLAAGRIRQGLTYAEETVLAVSPVLERRILLESTLSFGEQLLESTERRIARLGFDIHDGPLQGLAIVAGELSVLNRQLEAMGDGGIGAFAERRLGDVKDLVIDLGVDLRTIASTAAPGKLYLRETLEQEVAQLLRRTDIRVDLEVEGDVDATTASQRIAAARVVEEALANVREHSGATSVQVSVRRENGTLQLSVADNGRGFDVTRAMRRASRDRRLGLIAMEHRLRLLGGQLEVNSRPGGPTVISGSLPAWKPNGSASGVAPIGPAVNSREGKR
jgi:signal transduction histidine kinase